MAQCPNCSKTIAITDDNFGTLYRCEHCNAEFFIGFDGAPENSKDPLAADLIADQQPSEEPVEMLPPQQSNDLFSIQSPEDEPQEEMNSLPEMTSLPDMNSVPKQKGNAFKNFTDDVRSFGNDTSETGLLSFDIEISGIDLGETKRDLIEALEDNRFGWKIEDLTQNMKDGKLTISNVSAPKIIILVKRITALGLVLNWRHHVSTQ